MDVKKAIKVARAILKWEDFDQRSTPPPYEREEVLDALLSLARYAERMSWKEGVPPDDRLVLVAEDGECHLAHRDGTEWIVIGSMKDTDYVSHWLDFPAPPEK